MPLRNDKSQFHTLLRASGCKTSHGNRRRRASVSERNQGGVDLLIVLTCFVLSQNTHDFQVSEEEMANLHLQVCRQLHVCRCHKKRWRIVALDGRLPGCDQVVFQQLSSLFPTLVKVKHLPLQRFCHFSFSDSVQFVLILI